MNAMKFIGYTVAVCLLLVVVFFAFMFRIDANPLHIWDEAHVAVSALEMAQSNQYFIPTYHGVPDMWSVKPPLLVILQSFSMKLFGYNELGARAPTVLFAVGTVVLLFWFCVAVLKDFLAAFCSVLFLCTSGGYVCQHVARGADYDTALVFFLTAYFLFAFLYVVRKEYKFYLLFNLCLLLAVFTKGIAGVFFVPGIFLLYTIRKNVFREYFNLKHLVPPLVVLACVIGYYFIREQYNPGYIHTVIFEEMQGRLFDPSFNNRHEWYYLLELITSTAYYPWWLLAPVSLLLLAGTHEIEKKLIPGVWLTLVIFWIPLVVSTNKNEWYTAPSFPMLSLLSGVVFSRTSLAITDKIRHPSLALLLPYAVIFMLSILPVKRTIENSYALNERYGFAELVKSNRIPAEAKIISEGYNAPVDFYQKALKVRGTEVGRCGVKDLKPGDTVIAITTNDVHEVKEKFHCDVLYSCKETEMLFLRQEPNPVN